MTIIIGRELQDLNQFTLTEDHGKLTQFKELVFKLCMSAMIEQLRISQAFTSALAGSINQQQPQRRA